MPLPSSMRSLHSSQAIRAVFRARNAVHGRAMSVYARQVGAGGGRAAIVAGRSVGRAVERNRAKRRLRAVVAARGVPSDLQLVVVARPAAITVTFPTLEQEYERLLLRVSERAERSA